MSTPFIQLKKTSKNVVLLMTIICMIFIASCKDKHATNPTCMKLTKNQIEHWVKKGFFKSGGDSIAYIRLKTAYSGPGTIFKTYAVGLTMKGDVVPESLTELVPGEKCVVSLDDTYMVIGSSIFKMPYNKLFAEGILKKGISELMFVPFVDTTVRCYDMMNYSISSQEGVFTIEAAEQPVLCPPCANCIPPYPPKCKETKDSTGTE